VIRFLLIIQMPDARDKRGMALISCPIDCFPLRSEGREDMVGMVFDDIIVDPGPLRPALGAWLDVNVRHALLSLHRFCWWNENYTKPGPPLAT
jgi:hypothetical protein